MQHLRTSVITPMLRALENCHVDDLVCIQRIVEGYNGNNTLLELIVGVPAPALALPRTQEARKAALLHVFSLYHMLDLHVARWESQV